MKHLADEAGGGWIGPGGPTLTAGGQIDFALASKALLPVVTVQLDWATPFRPHAALRWSLDIGALSTHVPQLCGFKPQEPALQPFVLRAADRPVSILDHTDLSPLTGFLLTSVTLRSCRCIVLCKGAGLKLDVSMARCPSRAFPSLLGVVGQPLCGAACHLGKLLPSARPERRPLCQSFS